ncbi:hypothetical protein PS928_02896 [Pseudomonas fluorescens]|jgi:hypothetical protein|uniref:Uncharacterized protein n=1 Tax=Pseudomonas fluorescens TaxID=294 RepID=A0A5E7TZP4_PSEFL|nr:hypothetical protein PS928_02896 [Pseudomonas fluorescens]
MEHWKRTIERANRCFMLGELVDAREAYLQALALAQGRPRRTRAWRRPCVKRHGVRAARPTSSC